MNNIKRSIHYLLYLLICINLSVHAFAQNNNDVQRNPDFNSDAQCHTKVINQFFSDAVLVEEYLPDNKSKKGDIDYTPYIQKAIDENNLLIFPDYPILISPNGLKLKSNSKLYFPENSKLIVEANDLEKYAVLDIFNVKNIQLFFPKLIGDKENHLNDKGQWGMGISIKKSSNIKILYPDIQKFWGDGIYIGNADGVNNENITIKGGRIYKNRRNGISITSGENIQIKNLLVEENGGHNPGAGIDIEPNSNLYDIKSITIQDVISKNNFRFGIIIATTQLIGENIKNIDVDIENFEDYNSRYGLAVIVDYSNSKLKSNIQGIVKLDKISLNQKSKFLIKDYKSIRKHLGFQLNNISVDGSLLDQKYK